MNLSLISSKISNTTILSISFISFLVWQMVNEGVSWQLGLLIVFILSGAVFSAFKKPISVKKIEEPGPVIVVESISEDVMFEELANVMIDYNLELRLRRIEDGWNVTLLHHRAGLSRFVGVGSGRTISDALVKAEADFLEKVN